MSLKQNFLLRPDITFLNFGSFGACPKPVFETYQRFQRELESEPVQFFMFSGPRYLREARESLGTYLNASADDLVFVSNPSYAVNMVAKSLELAGDDEVLTTDLEYGACEKAWSFCCKKRGSILRKQRISLPLRSREETVKELFAGVNGKTRLIFVSHITSATALVLPVKEICAKARSMGIPCFVDGAHAPGQVNVDLGSLGADYYTGACHKWMMAPKGCAFLHVKRELQNSIDPLVVSWGYESATPSHSRFLDYHEGQGTRDYSAFISLPASVEFMKEHNWTEVSRNCRELVHRNASRFCELLNTEPLAPVNDEFIVQMLSLRINTPAPEALQAELFRRFSIEIPVMRHGDQNFLRYSINAFNDQADLDRLFGAIETLRKEPALLRP